MRVILNTNTMFEGIPLSIGTVIDVELKVAERWINKGIAHLPAQGGIITPELNADLIPLHDDLILNSKQQENLKKFIEETKEDIPEEEIFREPKIKEEIKVNKPVKNNKKKSK